MSKKGETQGCEFRWDVEVAFAEKQYGDKFLKQWRRILKAQRLGALGAKIPPRTARYQICANEETQGTVLASKQAAVEKAIDGLRRTENIGEEQIAKEESETHPLGWQGVRVWMTFERDAIEDALGKKPTG